MGADFVFTQPLFDVIDKTNAAFVTSSSVRVIAYITPYIAIAIAISLTIQGIAVMRGAVSAPAMALLERSAKIMFVTAIALTAGLYQGVVVPIITQGPDEFAAKIVTAPGATPRSASSIIDSATGQGLQKVSELWERGSIYSGQGWLILVCAVLLLLGIALVLFVGAAFIIIAKVALSILAAVGPLFIVLVLFPMTQNFFTMFIGQFVNYGLLIVVISTIFTFMIAMLGNFISGMNFDETQNAVFAMCGALGLTGVSAILLVKASGIVSGLAGGAALGGYMAEASAGYRGAKGVAGAAMGLAASPITAPMKAYRAARSIKAKFRGGS